MIFLTRRRALSLLGKSALAIAAFPVLRCASELPDAWYAPSTQQEILQFLREMHILKDDPHKTVYALTDWMTLNTSHQTENCGLTCSKASQEGKVPVLDVLTTRSENTIPIMGCYGVASIYDHLLGAVGIDVQKEYIILSGSKYHRTVVIPALDVALVHGDDVFYRRAVRDSEGNVTFQVDPSHLFVSAKAIVPFEEHEELWYHKRFEIDALLPDYAVLIYAFYKYNGVGSPYPLCQGSEHMPPRCPKVLKTADDVIYKLEQRIEELGGAQKAIRYEQKRVMTPENFELFVPADYGGN